MIAAMQSWWDDKQGKSAYLGDDDDRPVICKIAD